MGFERRGEAVVAAHDLGELKLIYRALHRQLGETPELMDSHFLTELQDFLHREAQAAGVDGTDPGAWEAWLARTSAASS